MSSIAVTLGTFLTKEVNNVENIEKAIGAFFKKEEPKVEKLFEAAVKDYGILKTAVPVIIADVQTVATLVADLSLELK